MKRQRLNLYKDFQKVLDKVVPQISKRLAVQSAKAIMATRMDTDYLGFTGNAFHSIFFKQYDRAGKDAGFPVQTAFGDPVHKKVALNRTVYLTNPVEGQPRAVKGQVSLLSKEPLVQRAARAARTFLRTPKDALCYFRYGAVIEYDPNLVKLLWHNVKTFAMQTNFNLDLESAGNDVSDVGARDWGKFGKAFANGAKPYTLTVETIIDPSELLPDIF